MTESGPIPFPDSVTSYTDIEIWVWGSSGGGSNIKGGGGGGGYAYYKSNNGPYIVYKTNIGHGGSSIYGGAGGGCSDGIAKGGYSGKCGNGGDGAILFKFFI